MQGMFPAHRGCGCVKKPDILLKDGSDNEVFDPKRKLQVKQTLKVGENFREKIFQSYSIAFIFEICHIYRD